MDAIGATLQLTDRQRVQRARRVCGCVALTRAVAYKTPAPWFEEIMAENVSCVRQRHA